MMIGVTGTAGETAAMAREMESQEKSQDDRLRGSQLGPVARHVVSQLRVHKPCFSVNKGWTQHAKQASQTHSGLDCRKTLLNGARVARGGLISGK